MSRKCISCGGEPTSEHASWFCQPCVIILSRNTSERDANRHLSASKHGSGRKRPEPERMSRTTAILIGAIIGLCLYALSFAGQWLDSIDFSGWLA